MTTSTVLILGAAGRLGQACVQAYAQAGWRVLAQQRKDTPLPAGAQRIATPLQDTAALAAQAAGAKVVVYGVNPLYHHWDRELLPLARLGMDVAERLQATFQLPGNVYDFGPQMPAVLRTDTPRPGGTTKGLQRVALEDELRARVQADRLRATVIRAGDFYGAGSGSWFDQAIVKDLDAGKLVYPGPLDLPHAWAYLPDLARAFVAMAGHSAWGEAAPFETVHFAGNHWTGRELIASLQAAADDLGLHPARGWRTGGMPWGLIRAVGLVHPLWRELARMSYLWRVPHVLDGSSLQAAVGRLPQTPPSTALRLSLQALGYGRALSSQRATA